MLLHTVNKSPDSHTVLQSCLRCAAANSHVLLMEDAVYAGVAGTQGAELLAARTDLHYYALREDAAARGVLEKISDTVQLVDYAGFVRLSVDCHAVHSWY